MYIPLLTLALFILYPKNVESTVEPLLTNSTIVRPQSELVSGLPVSIVIPKINLSTTIEYVGVTKQGEMDTPTTQTNVAWYALGTRPGEIGSAVIAGHYGWKSNEKSAFDNLNKLQKNDFIIIQDDKGKTITFIVREIKKYDPKSNTSTIFSSHDGLSHLNLITCGGIWDTTKKSYSSRLVIFTDKVEYATTSN